MHYVAYVSEEDGQFLAEFPDAPGCQTFAATPRELVDMAHEALDGWLAANLVSGQVPQRPKARVKVPRGAKPLYVQVNPGLSAVLQLRWARHEQGLSQAELARRAGVSQQQIAKLENPDENPTLATLSKVADALGLTLDVSFAPAKKPPTPAPTPARRTARKVTRRAA
jgi:predicted RNase H-like HicB family nuclease/DNA-binding XRE family transcriptional regulator